MIYIKEITTSADIIKALELIGVNKMTLDSTNRLVAIEGKSGAVIRNKEVLELLGVSRMTLRRWIAAGTFPQPLKANGRTFGFNYNSVIEWMNKLENKNDAQGTNK